MLPQSNISWTIGSTKESFNSILTRINALSLLSDSIRTNLYRSLYKMGEMRKRTIAKTQYTRDALNLIRERLGLSTLEELEKITSSALLSLVVRFGKTRLLDNTILK